MTALRTETTSWTVLEHLAVAMVCVDETGLDHDEVAALGQFERDKLEQARAGDASHWHWHIGDDRDEFAKCDITGLMGTCTTLSLVVSYIVHPAGWDVVEPGPEQGVA